MLHAMLPNCSRQRVTPTSKACCVVLHRMRTGEVAVTGSFFSSFSISIGVNAVAFTMQSEERDDATTRCRSTRTFSCAHHIRSFYFRRTLILVAEYWCALRCRCCVVCLSRTASFASVASVRWLRSFDSRTTFTHTHTPCAFLICCHHRCC